MARWFIDRTPQRNKPSVSLRRLLPEATFVGGRDWQVSGCSNDLRTLEPGQVFVAVGGGRDDSQTCVARAFDQGAVGVVVERPIVEEGRRHAVVPDARTAYARLCHALAGDPADKLDLIGITGGHDATLVSLLLRSVLDAAGQRFGQVGVQGWSDGLTSLPVGVGSPAADGLASMLNAMVKRKCVGGLVELSQPAIEATSLAEGVEFAAAIIPCVRETSDETEDALYARRRAYARVVRRVKPGGVVVVNEDDPVSEPLGATNLGATRISIGIDRPADVRAEVEWIEAHRAKFRLVAEGIETSVTLRLGGVEAIHAALAAAAVALSRGIDPATIAQGLESVDGIPGRFERVEEGQPFEVRIDAARSPEELAAALTQVREGRLGRVICVVGSEGHGDHTERARLAATAFAVADSVIFTSDNPRGEDPAGILDELHGGTDWSDHVRTDPDRRRAIETALSMAEPGDAVVIAGKGRNAFQILADRVVPFDDRAVAARWLRQAIATTESWRNSA
jgi:UDP-N-acetylmuramoyl-L-alanyl-D-glutamate--2,6-diaminopimelate ligase